MPTLAELLGQPYDPLSPSGHPDDLPGLPSGSSLGQVLANSQGVSDLFGTMTKDQQEPPVTIGSKMDPKTGQVKYSAEMTPEVMATVMKALDFQSRAVAGMQQHADFLAQREAQARANPLLNALSTVAGNLAVNDPRLPPLVAALGRSSLQLNPTPDQLAAERVGLQEQIGRSAGLMGESATRLLTTQTQLQEQRMNRQNAFLTHEMDKANARQWDEKAFLATAEGYGFSPEEAQAYAKHLSAAQEAAKTRQVEQVKEEAKARAEVKEAEIAPAREATARSIAAGDLTAIKDVSSMRSDEREKLYARVKELDPTFSTARLNRQIKMEESRADTKPGTLGGNITSLGTFLQHGGEAIDAAGAMQQSGMPIANKGLNWFKKNIKGSPELQAFITAIEPVQKEFEKFLLGGQALYGDDRRNAQIILNENSSPQQIVAALKQMGKTASDRFDELNHTYKHTMGKDIEDPFSERALIGAQKIGIQLGQRSAAGAPAAAAEAAYDYTWTPGVGLESKKKVAAPNSAAPAPVTRTPQPATTPTPKAATAMAANYPGASALTDPAAKPYVSAINDAAARAGISAELLARTIRAESGFNANIQPWAEADKRAGSAGIAQFTEATGRDYGLKTLADRQNPIKSIDAAARKLADLKRLYGGDELKAGLAYRGAWRLKRERELTLRRAEQLGGPDARAAIEQELGAP